jgi:hypothetical protein
VKGEISRIIDLEAGMNEQEKGAFVDELIGLVEHLKLLAGGGMKDKRLKLVLDNRSSTLTVGEIMDKNGEFLMEKEGLVSSFKME